MMTQMAGKGLMAGAIQTGIGMALQGVLSAINPILGMAAQLIAQKIQQRMMEAMTNTKYGMTQVQSEAVTTTVTSTRRRIDDGNITVLVQCDLGRLVTIDNAAHTYSVKTFDQLAAEGAQAYAADASGSAAPSASCQNPQATVERTADDQTDTIAGMTAHHKVEITNYTFPPSCNIKGDQMKWTTERWYATTDIPNQCSMPIAGNERDPQAAATVEVPLRIVRKADISQYQDQIQKELNGQKLPPEAQNSGLLDVMSHMGDMLTFTTETQSVKQVPIDPSLLDIPAGYAQSEGGATPPPSAMHGSS